MSFSLAHRCMRSSSGVILARRVSGAFPSNSTRLISKHFSNDNKDKESELGSSTILIQDGLNVQELPVIVRKIKDVFVLCDNKSENVNPAPAQHETANYSFIQEEFKQCIDLKDVFSLLSKCSKITPNIALGAVERIYEIETGNISSPFGEKVIHSGANMAKGAIMDKLLKVIMKTEDTQTLLNAVSVVSAFTEPYRYQLCDELLVRVSDNKLTVEQLCQLVHFLHSNRADPRLADTVDTLWAGFAQREKEINENNMVAMFNVLPMLKASKKTLINLLEKKLNTLWWKLKPQGMQEILEIFYQEKLTSHRSMHVVGRWTNTNIHALSEDTLLEIISKLTLLRYHDNQLEKALERYIKVKGIKINSHTLIVTILNHCMEFRVRNTHILSGCCEYFSAKGMSIPAMFLKSFIYPFGFLSFHPTNGVAFWGMVEKTLDDKFSRLKTEEVLDIVLSCIYLHKYPLNFVDKIFNPHFLAKVNNSDSPERLRIKLKLIDTAMSLECKAYSGPLLPKDHWAKSTQQDSRNKRIVNNISETLEKVAGGPDCFSSSVLIPNLFAYELYLIDVMLHPAGLGRSILNLKLNSDRNINVAMLIHLPEHYCANSDQLVGPQVMRKTHLRLLGLKVVSLKYKTLNTLRMHSVELQKYIVECLRTAETSLHA